MLINFLGWFLKLKNVYFQSIDDVLLIRAKKLNSLRRIQLISELAKVAMFRPRAIVRLHCQSSDSRCFEYSLPCQDMTQKMKNWKDNLRFSGCLLKIEHDSFFILKYVEF